MSAPSPPMNRPYADPGARPASVLLAEAMTDSEQRRAALHHRLGNLENLSEDDAWDLVAEMHASLDERKAELADETWAAIDFVQRRYGYSYNQMGPWLECSFEGVRKRLVDLRDRHRIPFTPQPGGPGPAGGTAT